MKNAKSLSLPVIAGSLLMAALAAKSFAAPSAVATGITIPGPSAVSYQSSVTYGPDGLLYAYDGLNVFKQGSLNSNSFPTKVNTATATVDGSDAGPITFTRDGATIVIGTGAGGTAFPDSQGEFLTVPAAGGSFAGPLTRTADSAVVSIPGQFSLAALPASSTVSGSAGKLVVDSGDFSSSQVSYFDRSSGVNTPVITGIPGSSTSVAFDNAGHFFVGVGFGAAQGTIKQFNVLDLDSAFNASTPLNFATAGITRNAAANNSGNGIFVADGDLFAGDGVGGLTVISASNVATHFDLGAQGAYITYNPTNDQFAVISTDFGTGVGLSTASVYRAVDFVPEPGAIGVLVVGTMTVLRRKRACQI